MKLRATVLGALLVLFAVTTAEALSLDAPHNESHGVYCFHCHSADPADPAEDYWFDAVPGGDIDLTRYNWVCNRCHAGAGKRTIEGLNNSDGSGDFLIGPDKQLHSSATTDSTKDPWTTQCVQCHDPHFQTQKDWGSDAFIDTGIFVTGPTYKLVADVWDPVTNDTGLGGPNGVTEITIDLVSTNIAPADWFKKGKVLDAQGNPFEDRAGDHTRGLIMVVDSLNSAKSKTFEIVKVTGSGPTYLVTLNGDARWLDDGLFATDLIDNGQSFGIIWGGSLRTVITTTSGETRTVKFFNPNKADGASGGLIDTTPGETAPVGICQVCHASTAYFKNDTEESSHNDAFGDGTECDDCHNIIVGGEPEIDHNDPITPIIKDVHNCTTSCHAGYYDDPDKAHIGDSVVDPKEDGCLTCHLLPAPKLSDGTSDGNVEARVNWSNDGGTHEFDPLDPWPLACIDCHNGSEGPVLKRKDYTNSAVHPDPGVMTGVHDGKLTAPPGFCVDVCHDTLSTLSTPEDIIRNTYGHNQKCSLCHVTLTPSPVELTALAESGRAGADCEGCHGNTYFNNHDHGVVNATDDGTAEHVITNVSPCDGCHDAVAGPSAASASAPDVIDPPYVGAGEVHSGGCLTCHRADNGGPFGSADIGWPGGDWKSPAGGNDCTACHGAYFGSHLHHNDVDKNEVSFNSSNDRTVSDTPCSTCHQDIGAGTASLDDWDGIIYEHDTDGPQDGGTTTCATCHSFNGVGLYSIASAATVATAISSGNPATCGTCHTKKGGVDKVDHGGHIAEHFDWGGDCADCHGLGAAAEEVVLEIHGDNCNLCHYDPDNLIGVPGDNYNRILGPNDGDGDAREAVDKNATCLTCHVTGTIDKPFIHHDSALSCNSVQCHNSATGHQADHSAAMVMDAPVDVANMQKECSSCHGAYSFSSITSPADGNNTPLDGGDAKIHDACTTCHYVHGADYNIVKLKDPLPPIAEAMPNSGDHGGTNGGGTCKACHTTYFDAHTHHDNGGLNQLTINTAADNDPTWEDVSWGGYFSCGADGPATACHQDWEDPAAGNVAAGTALDTWAGVRYEHDRPNTPAGNVKDVDGKGSCANCHYDNSRTGSSVNAAKFGVGASVQDVVEFLPKTATNCTDCHLDKKAPNVHGLIYVDHFEMNTTYQATLPYKPIIDNPECGTCHTYDISGASDPFQGGDDTINDTDDIVIGLHRNSCVLCHVSQPDLLDDTGKKFVNYAISGGVHCVDCHQNAADFNELPETFHGMTTADMQTRVRHEKLGDSDVNTFTDTSGTKLDCLACHYEMFDVGASTLAQKKLARHLVPGPNSCETCHEMVGSQADTVIKNGRQGSGNTNQPCENCHAASGDYQLHAMNDADAQTATLHDNLSADATCNTGCHGDLSSESAMLGLHTGVDGTGPVATKGGCQECHAADQAPSTARGVINDGRSAVDNGDVVGGANPSGITCVSCHPVGTTDYLMHGMTNAAAEGIHQNLAGTDGTTYDFDCEACHIGAGSTAFEKRLDLHVNCLTCHGPGAGTPASTQITAGIGGATVNCEDCHDAKDTYRLHGMTNAAVEGDTEHNRLLSDAACTGCHTIGNEANILAVHNDTLGGKDGCVRCHTAAPAGTGDAPAVILAGKSATGKEQGTDFNQACVNCHTVANDYLMHGMDNPGAAGVHLSLLGSNPAQSATSNNCDNCHDTSSPQTRMALHASCDMCHGEGTTPATTQIAAGILDNDVYCQSCHDAPGKYTLHAVDDGPADTADLHNNISIVSSGYAGDDDCVNCHDMTTEALVISLHTNPTNGAHVNNNCVTCHGFALSMPAGFAALAIKNGRNEVASGGGNAMQNCSNCHASKATLDTTGENGKYSLHGLTDVNSVEVHDQLASESGSVDASCSSCHTIPSQTERVQIHTQGPSGYTCLTSCHSSSANSTVKTVIAAGWNDAPTAANCDDCHTTYFSSHTHHANNVNEVRDNDLAGSNTENCIYCHTATTTPFIVGGTEVHNPAGCGTCHDLTSEGVGSNDDGKLITGSSSITGGGECVDCHKENGGAYFDSHIDRAADSGTNAHNFVLNTDVDLNIGDWAQDSGNEELCYGCHDDANGLKNANALDAWTEVNFEHQTVGGSTVSPCETCHNSYFSSIDTAAFGAGTVQTVIADGTAVRCLSCHYVKKNPAVHGGHNSSHFGWDGGCSNCHGAGGETEAVVGTIHGDKCDLCHTGTGTNNAGTNGIGDGATANYGVDGDAGLPGAEGDAIGGLFDSTCTTCHPTGTYDLSTVHHDSLEWSVTNPGSCTATCHVQGDIAAISGDHTTYVSLPANCNACHDGAQGNNTFGMPLNADPKIHNSCETCHVAGPDAILVGAGGLADSMPAGGGTCEDCHTALFEVHASHTHAASVTGPVAPAEITDDCLTAGCHVATTKPYTDDLTIHNPTGCASCHDGTTGALITGPSGKGDATGSTGECVNCHAAWFDGHQNSNGTGGHLIQRRAGETDGTDTCEICHGMGDTANANKFVFNSWSGTYGIWELHDVPGVEDNGCVFCHDSTRNNTNAPGTIDPLNLGESVQDVIQNGTAVDSIGCLDCHYDRSSSHGGHALGDFAWDAAGTTACGASGCHDTAQDVVTEIHNGSWATNNYSGVVCLNCHSSASGGATTQLGPNGNGDSRLASLATGAPHTDTCETCHPPGSFTKAFIHHDHPDVATGTCTTCHADPRPGYSGGANIAYKQLACSRCHVVDDGASGIKVVQFSLRDASTAGPSKGADATLLGNIQSDVANHDFPNTPLAPGILNYGACFACHGASGMANTKPLPWHALPTPTLVSAKNDLGALDFVDVNTMGGGGFDIQETDGWSYYPTTGLDYRGGIDANKWVNAYFPIGKSVINIGWALYSQPKKATQNIQAYQNNGGLYNDAQFNLAADLTFGVVNNNPNNSDFQYFIPHFDTVPPAGVDVVTGSIGDSWSTGGGGAGPVSARTLSPNCDSDGSQGSYQISLVYGGHTLVTGAVDAALNTTVDLDTEATNILNAASKTSLYHSISAGVAFCVSTKGGVLKVVNGQPAN